MTDVKFFECFWKHSIFCRCSLVLKVLAHEKSGEIQKKIVIFNFHSVMREVLIKHSHDEVSAKF